MLEDERDLEQVRLILIELLQNSHYSITRTSEVTGKKWLRQFHQFPSEMQMIDLMLDLLLGLPDPLQIVEKGEPPGSRGIAYRVVDPLWPEFYIKVKIEEERVFLLSFKRSDHARGGQE